MSPIRSSSMKRHRRPRQPSLSNTSSQDHRSDDLSMLPVSMT